MSEVRTDHKWKNFKTPEEVPQRIQDWYDWLDPEDADDRWVKYKDRWFHISDFIRTVPGGELHEAGWEGYEAGKIFSATVLRVSADGEQYQIGEWFA